MLSNSTRCSWQHGGSWYINEGDPKVSSGHRLGSWAPISLTTPISLQQPLDSHDISRASTHGGYRSTIAALEQEVSFAEAAFLARREREPKISKGFQKVLMAHESWLKVKEKKKKPPNKSVIWTCAYLYSISVRLIQLVDIWRQVRECCQIPHL